MVVKLALKRKNENIQIWSRYSLFKNTDCSLPASSSAALKHPKEVAPDCSSLKWLMVDTAYHSDHLRCLPISPRWHNVIQNPSHPDELASGRISSPMNYGQFRMSSNLLTVLSHPEVTICHPDDLAEVSFLSGWVMAMLLYHPNDIRSYCWFIRMTNQILIYHNTQWPFSASVVIAFTRCTHALGLLRIVRWPCRSC